MDNIRVAYSGLLGFAVAMGGMIAGIVFIIIVTRQLEPEEFGVWAIIGSMTTYSVVTKSVTSYWTTRQIARGIPVGKTAMESTSFFVGGSISIYILSVYLFTNIESAFFDSMLLGVIMIPVLLIQSTLSAVNTGHKPQAVSIGMAAFQFFKIPTGLALVFFLGLGLDGAILTVFIAHLSDIAVQLHYARSRLAVPRDFSYLRGWIKQGWMPLYERIPTVLHAMDVIIYTVIIGSVIGVAYYAAALIASKMVKHTMMISHGLYPKLLTKSSKDHISDNLTLVMYFAIPLVILAVLFSKHTMFLLNPEYAQAWMAGVLLTFGIFQRVIMKFLKRVLMGTDDVDVNETPSASALLHSRLFMSSTVENVYHAVYLTLLAASLYMFRDLSELELVTIWSSVMLSVSAPFLLYYVVLVRRHAPFRVKYMDILKHMIGGIGMVVVFVLTNEHIIVFDISIYMYLPRLLLEMAICCATYIGITYAIDKKTRKLFGLMLSEISSRRRGE